MTKYLNKNINYSLVFIFLAIIAVVVFWKSKVALSVVLLIIFFVKNKLIPLKKEFIWFIISAIVGSLGECLIMFSGPWKYSYSDIINFPLWLPFLWGLAGTIGVSLYLGMTEIEK